MSTENMNIRSGDIENKDIEGKDIEKEDNVTIDVENSDLKIKKYENKTVEKTVNENIVLEEADGVNYRMNYEKSKSFWSQASATSDTMLFGCENAQYECESIAKSDLKNANYFLNWLFTRKDENNKLQGRICLDCGAGIGRIMPVLERYFQKVDMVEQNLTFVEKVQKDFANNPRLGEVMCGSVQDFKPTKMYDLIWAQWVFMYLRDNDVVDFLKKVRESLYDTGILVIKGNLTDDKGKACKSEMDEDDSSVTRTLSLVSDLAVRAGFKVLRIYKDENLPSFFEIHTLAFEPDKKVMLDTCPVDDQLSPI